MSAPRGSSGASPVSGSALELVRALVAADERWAARLAELEELLARAAAVRRRSDSTGALLASAPAERERLGAELRAARDEVAERRAALTEADAELAAAETRRDEERLAAARRFQVRAKDALAISARREAAAAEACAAFEDAVLRAEHGAPAIEAEALGLARELQGRAWLAAEAGRAPGGGLAGVAEWAQTARAALLVARSRTASERDAVVREANELGSLLLGEPLVASSAALVARRLADAASR